MPPERVPCDYYGEALAYAAERGFSDPELYAAVIADIQESIYDAALGTKYDIATERRVTAAVVRSVSRIGRKPRC